MNDYIKYVNLVICDSSISFFEKNVPGFNFTSFNPFINYIKNCLIMKDIDKINPFLDFVFKDLIYVFGMDLKECTKLVISFLMNDNFHTYYDVTSAARKYLNNFLVP